MTAFLQRSQFLLAYIIFIFSLGFLVSCSKDDPVEEHEHEEFSHVEFTVKTGTTQQKLVWNNEDEGFEGENKTIELTDGVKSEVSIEIWNRHDGENENITTEIKGEVDVHQFFYEFASVAVAVAPSSRDPKDSNGVPLKLITDWTPSGVGVGKVTITLIHEPTNKTGTRAQAGGDADFEITIDVTIE